MALLPRQAHCWIGSLQRPEVVVVGRYRGKELEVVGRTVKLTEAQSAAIGELLKPTGAWHPRPDQISTHWGRGSKTPIVKVRPVVVVEVAARCRPAITAPYCVWSGAAAPWSQPMWTRCRLADQVAVTPGPAVSNCCSASAR